MYSTWRISELKAELKKRGASLQGRKADLVDRLELYDRNFNFGNTGTQSNDDPLMDGPPSSMYRDINSNTALPPLTKMHIRQYFCFVNKKLDEAKALYESRYLILARATTVDRDFTYIKGFCKKTMKSLQYEVDIKIHKNGTPQESHCECPAGSGIEAKCKHVAVLLWGVEHMVRDKIMLLHQVCTQRLQTFHVPKVKFTASPIAAHNLPRKKPDGRFFPYPTHTINKEEYNNKIRNIILNYPNSTMPLKQLFDPANPYAIGADHAYTATNPENETLEKLKLENISEESIQNIQQLTRGQKNCSVWYEERRHRITASKLHTVCHLRESSKASYSRQLLNQRPFTSRATTHGIMNEDAAIKEYESKYGLSVENCGFYISKQRPYLGASPDGLLGDDTIIEVKCPYSTRNAMITPVTVPYLVNDVDNNRLLLKKTSPYYYQIQGQLYCTNRSFCNLIVYTFKALEVIYVSRDEEFISVMIEKVDNFYNNYFKQAILNKYLYKNYDLIKKQINNK